MLIHFQYKHYIISNFLADTDIDLAIHNLESLSDLSSTTTMMESLLFIAIATLLALTNGFDEIKLSATVIPGQYETCPPQDILEMARQRISARVDDLITG